MFRKITLPFVLWLALMTGRSNGSCIPVQAVFTATETGCGWFKLHLELVQGGNVWVQWIINGKYKLGSTDTSIYVGDKVPFTYTVICGNECSNAPFSGNLVSRYKRPVLLGANEVKTGCNEFSIALKFKGDTSDMNCSWNLDGETGLTSGISLSHTFFTNGIFPYTVEVVNTCNEHYRFDGKLIANDIVRCEAGQNFSVCYDQKMTSLSGIPSGGQWIGNGVQGNDFNAKIAGPGKHSLIYIYSKEGCRSFDTVEAEVIKPDATVFIEPTINPAPAPVKFQMISNGPVYKYSWNFGDQKFSEEEAPIHIYENAGTYFPSLDIYDEKSGCHQSLALNPLIIAAPLVVSSKTVEFENHMSVSPNPASGYLRITTDLDLQKETFRIQLCDLSGVLLRESDILFGEYTDIYIPQWSAGCYLIRLIGNKGSQYTRKFIGLQ